MDGCKKSLVIVFSSLMVFASLAAFADKTSVEIEAPAAAKKGETVTIKIKVTHDGNNIFHYTNWVYVKVNGKEIKRWEYSMFSLPEDEVFTREITYTVSESVDIEAEGNCNIHGSTGKKTVRITVK